ncbi:MAG: tRNA pseudouridine(54/55) synthase Pus10, partial [Candidatus Thorarchaeota archaeon]
MTVPTESRVLDTTKSMLEKHPLCDRCLGRQFAWLSTQTSNEDRGRSLKLILSMIADEQMKTGDGEQGKSTISLLAGKGMFTPAQVIAEKNNIAFDQERQCHLCSVDGQSIFERVNTVARRAAELTKEIEFDSFLVGTVAAPLLDDRQDELRAEYSLLHAEALKSDFSRELGKQIYDILGKEVNFEKPHLVFLYDMINDKIRLQINPIFIYGRYRKLKRGIPQSRWDCKECKGKGCDECKGT